MLAQVEAVKHVGRLGNGAGRLGWRRHTTAVEAGSPHQAVVWGGRAQQAGGGRGGGRGCHNGRRARQQLGIAGRRVARVELPLANEPRHVRRALFDAKRVALDDPELGRAGR